MDILNQLKAKSVCFTGHRPPAFSDEYKDNDTKREVREFLHKLVFEDVWCEKWITGGALGVDTWAADAVLKNEQSLHLYLPFPSMGDNWPDVADRTKLSKHKMEAKEVKTLSPTFSNYAYIVRDQAMVNDAELVVAVWNGQKSGTGATFAYAQKLGRYIYHYHPVTKEETLYKGYEVL